MLSVIIPTLNGSKLVESCISSFKKTVPHSDYELIVVDDGSTLEEKEKLRSLAARNDLKLVEIMSRGGYAKAVNAGLNVATGSYLLLLNNDVVFQQSGWLDYLLATAEAVWNIGIVGCRLLYPDNSIQHAGGILLTGERYDHLHRNKKGDYPKAGLICDVESVTGALMLIKREVFNEIGLLSEDYLLSYEDVDYCLRARQAGWRVVYCGQAAAVHDEGSTRGKIREDKPDDWYEEELRSHITFWTRWRNNPLTKPLGYIFIAFILGKNSDLPSNQTIVDLISGLKEQGCQVYLKKVEVSNANREIRSLLGNHDHIKCGAVFTNDLSIERILDQDPLVTLPIYHISSEQWDLFPYPQNVYELINKTSQCLIQPK